MKPPSVDIARVLPSPSPGTLTVEEAQAILKIAFLAGEADGDVADEEQESFAGLAVALRKLVNEKEARMSEESLDALLDDFSDQLDKSGRAACVQATAKALKRELAREVAYKVSVAMTLTDMERSEEEGDFDDEVVAALGLSEEQADTLAGDVYAALGDEEDDDDGDG